MIERKQRNIRYGCSHIFRSHRRLRSVLAAFGGCLAQFLAKFVQSASGMRPVGIVVTDQEHLLPLLEDIIGDLHTVLNRGNKRGEWTGLTSVGGLRRKGGAPFRPNEWPDVPGNFQPPNLLRVAFFQAYGSFACRRWENRRLSGPAVHLKSSSSSVARVLLSPDRVHYFFLLGTAGTILPKQLV